LDKMVMASTLTSMAVVSVASLEVSTAFLAALSMVVASITKSRTLSLQMVVLAGRDASNLGPKTACLVEHLSDAAPWMRGGARRRPLAAWKECHLTRPMQLVLHAACACARSMNSRPEFAVEAVAGLMAGACGPVRLPADLLK